MGEVTQMGLRGHRAVESPASSTFPPPEVSDHALIRQIGEGAYGEVWLARCDTGLYRAVKVVRRARFQSGKPYGQELRGIKAYEPISRTDDSLVDVLQVGINSGGNYFYYVMELADDVRALEGLKSTGGVGSAQINPKIDPKTYVPGTLAALINRKRRVPIQRCLDLGIAMASALTRLHTHEQGFVHRDVSPGNILFVGGKPKLGDPGTVVHFLEAKSLVGTQGYIPPEGPGTAKGDIYSAGKVLYVAMTGLEPSRFPELPVDAKGTSSWAEILELNPVFEKACHRDPDRRYGSALEMLQDLECLRQGRSLRREVEMKRQARRFRIALAVSAMLLTGLLLSSLSYRRITRAQLDLQSVQIEASQRELDLARRLIESERKQIFVQIDQSFTSGNTGAGVAQLARILREDPTNQVAASRLISALTDRNFALPAVDRPMRHEGEVFWAEYSPNGERVVTASRDGTARVWDARTGEPLTPPMQHADQVKFACFSPDGTRVATASFDNTARVWDSETGLPVTPELRHEAWVNRVHFSPDGRSLVTASKDGTARFWDPATGESKGVLRVFEGEVNDCQFSPDGKRVVSASQDRFAHIWDVDTGTIVLPPLEHENQVAFAVFSPDGARIVTTSDDFTARLWDARTARLIGAPLGHSAQVRMAAFSWDSCRVVTASWDETSRVWDATTGRPITPPMKHADQLREAVFSPDGLRVATASADFTARVWDAWSGVPLTESIRHPNKLRSVQFSRDGSRLLTGATDGTARIWDIRNGTAVSGAPVGSYFVRNPDFSADGRLEFQWSGLNGRKVLANGQFLGTVTHRDRINSAQFSRDGPWIVTASDDATARIWDARTLEPVGGPLRHAGNVLMARFRPDGTQVVTASADGTARLWDTRTGTARGIPMRHEKQVRYAEFSPDGTKVASASDDGAIRVWDASTGRPLTSPLPHPAGVLFAHFSPDGQRILSACKDFAVRVWDARNGQPVLPKLQQADEIIFAEFSSDAEMIAVACEDKTVRVWDVKAGGMISGPMRHRQPLANMTLSRDGRRIATATRPATIRLWDSYTGLPVSEPRTLANPVVCLEFSLDGQSLLALCVGGREELRFPPAEFVVPQWLPDLAEAIVGMRWVQGEGLEALGQPDFGRIREMIERDRSNDYCSSWARWFVADRDQRPISPVATETIAGRVDSMVNGAVQR